MITNRPEFLIRNLPHYKNFPKRKSLKVDLSNLPLLLNLDFNYLDGIQPITKSRINYLLSHNVPPIVNINPSETELEYYKKIGVREFQCIKIILNFYVLNDIDDDTIEGIPYNVSLMPMLKRGKIDTISIENLTALDLQKVNDNSNIVYTDFNPFQKWNQGMGMSYEIFARLGYDNFTDSLGFNWGIFFLSPVFDKREVKLPENKSYSNEINAKFRRYKTNLYFKSFSNAVPRRVFGCVSPIELFLLQGLHIKNLTPNIQTSIYKTGEIISNYFDMQRDEVWLGQERLITEVDLYFPEKKLAIFCDGKEFHDAEKDRRIVKELEQLGIQSLRFSGKQITENLEAVLNFIERQY